MPPLVCLKGVVDRAMSVRSAQEEWEAAKRCANMLLEDRRRRFSPKCPVITGTFETAGDREFLELEELRRLTDKEHMESPGVQALERIKKAREKKRRRRSSSD